MQLEEAKDLVRQFVQAINERDETAVDELTSGELACRARAWVRPFDTAFPDFRMELEALVAEGDTVVAQLRCSGTHQGAWLGILPTGRRFEDVDKIYVFRLDGGRIVAASGVEDNLTRIQQLDLTLSAPAPSGDEVS